MLSKKQLARGNGDFFPFLPKETSRPPYGARPPSPFAPLRNMLKDFKILTFWPFFGRPLGIAASRTILLPVHYPVQLRLLLPRSPPQINPRSLYTLMAQQVRKHRYVPAPLQKIPREQMTERMWIDHFRIEVVFPGISLQLLGDAAGGKPPAPTT